MASNTGDGHLPKGYKELTGAFVVPFQEAKTADDNDSSEDEEGDGDILLDYRDMHAAEHMIRARVPKLAKVEIKDKNKKHHACHGRFLMTQPYWEVAVKMNRTYLRSSPVYSLQPDLDGAKQSNMVNILLSDCLKNVKESGPTRACFETFCREQPSFTNLGKLLFDFIKIVSKNGCFCRDQPFGTDTVPADHSVYIKENVLGSDLGSCFLVAASHPELVRTLSKLFPYAFPQICNKLSRPRSGWKHFIPGMVYEYDEDEDDVEDGSGDEKELLPVKSSTDGRNYHHKIDLADNMSKNSPWEFCFKDILMNKLKVYGVEASLKCYENSGFMAHTPQMAKDALYIYEILKVDAKRDGHMFMPFKVLKGYYYFAKLNYQISGMERWQAALDYLEMNEIIKREEFGGDVNTFLIRNYQAEVDTRDAVKTILLKHFEDPFVWDIDFNSPDFTTICTDKDQLLASHLICSSPVVVMSGRGGCGKTTVITKILKHLCDREQERIDMEKERALHEFDGDTNLPCVTDHESIDIDRPLSELSLSKLSQDSALKSIVSKLDTNPGFANIVSDNTNGNNDSKWSQLGASKPSSSKSSSNNQEGLIKSEPTPNNKCHQLPQALQSRSNSISSTVGLSDPKGENSTSCLQENRQEASAFSSLSKTNIAVNSASAALSKVDRLKRELVDDLLKILSESKEKDDPELIDYKQTMLLTAPTGKAARLLGCKAGLPSATLHSVLTSWQAYRQGTRESAWRYARVKILVVDECSLVSVRLFANTVKILLDQAKLRKLVLLGDVRQLPSIEPGNFLKDMFKTLGRPIASEGKSVVTTGRFSMAVELSQNHRSESQLIVDNADMISRMIMPTFDSQRNFHLLNTSLIGGDNERDQVVRQLLQTAPELKSHLDSQFVAFRNVHCTAINELCCRFYNNHSLKQAGGSANKQKFDFQVGDKICLCKNHLVTSKHAVYLDDYKQEFPDLAEALDKHEACLREKLGLNKEEFGEDKRDVTKRGVSCDETKTDTRLDAAGVLSLLDEDESNFNTTISAMKEKEEIEREARRERAKQKQHQWKTKKEKETSLKNAMIELLGNGEEKLCNGEVFFIMDEMEHFSENSSENRDASGVIRSEKYLLLSDRDPVMPRVVCVKYKDLRKLCKMRHSWVRTIHTYQGSESGTVVYVLGAAIPQTWQHVYTAVTRGKQSVYVIGDSQELYKAVSRRPNPRRSRLSHRLSEMLQDQGEALEICETEFLRRLHEGSTSEDPTNATCEHNSPDYNFGSDDSWLLHAESLLPEHTSKSHGQYGQDSSSNRESIPQPHVPRPSIVESASPDQASTSRSPLVLPSNQNFEEADENDAEISLFGGVISSVSSSDDEMEESIFAPLKKFKEKKKMEMISMDHITVLNKEKHPIHSKPCLSEQKQSVDIDRQQNTLFTKASSSNDFYHGELSENKSPNVKSPDKSSFQSPSVHNRTPSKRQSSDGEGFANMSDWDTCGATSPQKVQKIANQVGTPLLNSFSHSLTFDEDETEGEGKAKFSEESPFGVTRRKL